MFAHENITREHDGTPPVCDGAGDLTHSHLRGDGDKKVVANESTCHVENYDGVCPITHRSILLNACESEDTTFGKPEPIETREPVDHTHNIIDSTDSVGRKHYGKCNYTVHPKNNYDRYPELTNDGNT